MNRRAFLRATAMGGTTALLGVRAKRPDSPALVREPVTVQGFCAGLWYGGNPLMAKLAETVRTVAHQRNVAFTPIRVSRADELESMIGTAARERPQAVIVTQDSWSLSNRARIVPAVHAKGVPVVAASRLFAESGALVSYGPDLVAVYKRAAIFVDKILKGTKPGDIPVEQPTKFELVINLKTAQTLGLTIPHPLLLRADQVIQ